MKIICPQCKTSYDISDDRIPDKCVESKCKKCGHPIKVEKKEIKPETDNDLPEEAKPKKGLLSRVKKQAGEIGEKAKESADGLGKKIKSIDKEQLAELAERTSEISARHSGKIDRFLLFSFRFGKFVSALFLFLFFFLFIAAIAYYFLAGNAGLKEPRFEDVKKMMEGDEKSYSSNDFSEIDRKRDIENRYDAVFKKLIREYSFSEESYKIFVNWTMEIPEKFQEDFVDGLEDFLKDTKQWAKKNNEKSIEYPDVANTYKRMFLKALQDMEMKEQELAGKKKDILISVASALVFFIIFLIIPILIKIEENTRNTVTELQKEK